MTDQMMSDDSTEREDARPSSPARLPARAVERDRRTVLRAAGLVALAGGGSAVLAACASGETTTPAATSAAPSSTASSRQAPSSAAPSSAASSSASSPAAAPSGPSVATADVPVGSGVILDDADYVITQPTKGDFKAFTAICTHQQCKVSEMRDDVIHCGCHQSDFSVKDGSVVNPPAEQPLKEFTATVSGNKVYVEE